MHGTPFSLAFSLFLPSNLDASLSSLYIGVYKYVDVSSNVSLIEYSFSHSFFVQINIARL